MRKKKTSIPENPPAELRFSVPEGMPEVLEWQITVGKNEDAYQRGGCPLPPLIITLDKHNGRTYLTQYLAAWLKERGLRSFDGQSTFLEYTADGSLAQLKRMFRDIESQAVYSNLYHGVIAIGLEALAPHVFEDQTRYFLGEIEKVGTEATCIFFFSASPSKKESRLMEKIRGVFPGSVTLHIPQYNPTDLALITVSHLMDRALVETSGKFYDSLQNLIAAKGVKTARDTIRLADEIIFYADYNRAEQPVVDCTTLESVKLQKTGDELTWQSAGLTIGK